MVLTAAQITVFFEGASQMAIPHNTRVQFQSESIKDHSDLVDFTEEDIAMISQNLKRPRVGFKIQILMPLRELPYQHHPSYLELRVRCVS